MQHIALRRRSLWVVIFCLGLVPFTIMAASWPETEDTEIGQGVLAEPSGATTHNGQLYVVDDGGYVAAFEADGLHLGTVHVGYDLEGVTSPDADGPIILLGVERPDSVLEYNTETRALTGNDWDLTSWMQSNDDNRGLEALTYARGLTYAALQETGDIYVFDLKDGGVVDHIATIASPTGKSDLSALHYDGELFWAVHDSSNMLVSMMVDSLHHPTNFEINETFSLRGDAQEGIAMIGRDLFIGEDSGEIWRYGNFLPEPPGPDYSTAVSYEIQRKARNVVVTYAGGDVQNIEVNKKRPRVAIFADGEYVLVIDKKRGRLYKNGALEVQLW